MPSYYHKIVSKRELDITLIASQLGISPPIVSYGKSTIEGDIRKLIEGDEGWYFFEMMYYTPITYISDIDKDEIMLHYNRLLDEGIVYFDMSINNMVKNDGHIYLIDFGHSTWINMPVIGWVNTWTRSSFSNYAETTLNLLAAIHNS